MILTRLLWKSWTLVKCVLAACPPAGAACVTIGLLRVLPVINMIVLQQLSPCVGVYAVFAVD
jgi:hypothetical protein